MVHDEFKLVAGRGLTWLNCAGLSRLPWLLHAFSTRLGGTAGGYAPGLNLGFTANEPRARVERHRRRFFAALGAGEFALASLRQIHSAHVYLVERDSGGGLEYHPAGCAFPDRPSQPLLPGDSLVTAQPGILLSIRTADCLPVLLVDPEHRAVAAVHAGWRGALARVIEKTVGEMRRLMGSRPSQLIAALGPSIRACCYEVGEEVVEAFTSRYLQGDKFFVNSPRASRTFIRLHAAAFLSAHTPGHEPPDPPRARLDLVAVAREQLLSGGLTPRHIHVAEYCTACRTDLFYSYRREGSRAGRMMAVIGIRPETLAATKRRST